MPENETLATDVLIIGSGAAGTRAAIEAAGRGVNVVLTSKGAFGADGAATWMAGPGFQVAMNAPDSPDRHAEDTIKGGHYLNNQELVYKFLRLGPRVVQDLARWGVNFNKREDKYWQVRYPGHSLPRSMRHQLHLSRSFGTEYRRVLRDRVRRNKQITVVNNLFVTDLLLSDNGVIGAIGMDMVSGGFKRILAKSTILATGGFSAIYDFYTGNETLVGDGHGIAFRAGVKMMDMEFVQFMPLTSVWPPSIRGDYFPYSLMVEVRALFYNKLGERFMERYYPDVKEFATREAQGRAIAREVREGRGSPHGGCYLSLNHLPRNLLDEYLAGQKDVRFFVKLEEAGIDVRKDGMEVSTAGHYTQGGCWINDRCETSLPGLYAIGEIGTGGKDGADRLGGNAMTFCFAMGMVGGEEAAERAKNVEMPGINETQAEELAGRASVYLERIGGIRPAQVKAKVRQLMSKHAAFARSKPVMEEGLAEVKRIEAEELPQLYCLAKNRRFNLEWVDALEAANMVWIARAVLSAALMRTESRGLHERTDFPEENPDWMKHIMVEKRGDEMAMFTEPVTFPYIKPPQAVRG